MSAAFDGYGHASRPSSAGHRRRARVVLPVAGRTRHSGQGHRSAEGSAAPALSTAPVSNISLKLTTQRTHKHTNTPAQTI